MDLVWETRIGRKYSYTGGFADYKTVTIMTQQLVQSNRYPLLVVDLQVMT